MNVPILSLIPESEQFYIRKPNKRLTDRQIVMTQRQNSSKSNQDQSSVQTMSCQTFRYQYKKNPFFRAKMNQILKSNQKIINSKGFQNYKSNLIQEKKLKYVSKKSTGSKVRLLTGREEQELRQLSLYQTLYKIIEWSAKKQNQKQQNSDKNKQNSIEVPKQKNGI